MDWLKKFYKFFWSRTSARPWTYEIRDWTIRHPFAAGSIATVTVIGGVTSQVVGVVTFGYWAVPVVVFWDFMAFVGGHLYWDTAGAYVKVSGHRRRTFVDKVVRGIKDWLSWREV